LSASRSGPDQQQSMRRRTQQRNRKWDELNAPVRSKVSGPALASAWHAEYEQPWYLASMEVSVEDVPPGMMAMTVQHRNMRCSSTLPTLGQTYQYIMEQWQPRCHEHAEVRTRVVRREVDMADPQGSPSTSTGPSSSHSNAGRLVPRTGRPAGSLKEGSSAAGSAIERASCARSSDFERTRPASPPQ
jgi:hypothetical protein